MQATAAHTRGHHLQKLHLLESGAEACELDYKICDGLDSCWCGIVLSETLHLSSKTPLDPEQKKMMGLGSQSRLSTQCAAVCFERMLNGNRRDKLVLPCRPCTNCAGTAIHILVHCITEWLMSGTAFGFIFSTHFSVERRRKHDATFSPTPPFLLLGKLRCHDDVLLLSSDFCNTPSIKKSRCDASCDESSTAGQASGFQHLQGTCWGWTPTEHQTITTGCTDVSLMCFATARWTIRSIKSPSPAKSPSRLCHVHKNHRQDRGFPCGHGSSSFNSASNSRAKSSNTQSSRQTTTSQDRSPPGFGLVLIKQKISPSQHKPKEVHVKYVHIRESPATKLLY